MPDRKTALRDELVEAQQQLDDVLDSLHDADWERIGPNNEGWCTREILIHLTTSEVGFIGTLKKMAAGEGGVPADFDPNRWNAGQQRRNTQTDPTQLRSSLSSAHAEMLELLSTLDDRALDQRGHLSDGRDGSTEDNFRLVASHKRAHTEDLRAALAQPTGSMP